MHICAKALVSSKENLNHSFQSLQLVSTRKEPGFLTFRTTVTFVLQSKAQGGIFSSRIVQEILALDLVIYWSNPMVDLQSRHKKWLVSPTTLYKQYHPMRIGFSEALKSLRADSSDWIKSKSKIQPPFRVQTFNYDNHKLLWCENSTKLLYVGLKATEERYAIQQDNDGLVYRRFV